MANVTITVSDDIKKIMDQFDEVNWSAVARNAFAEKINNMLILEKLSAKSKLTEKDALELGRKVKQGMWERHYKKVA